MPAIFRYYKRLERLREKEGLTLAEIGGEVASINTGVDLRSEGEGMGISFASLSDEQQKIVNELYGRAMDEVLEG
jgi:hypothetical protein